VVADANDEAMPPAVFLKGGSVRFEATEEPQLGPVWVDSTLAHFEKGVAYADGVSATADASYTVSAGERRAGVSLNAETGAGEGTPTSSGPYAFTSTASNELGAPVHAGCSGVVVAAAEWPAPTLPAFVGGTAYHATLVATGEPGPSFDLTGGALPAGVTL